MLDELGRVASQGLTGDIKRSVLEGNILGKSTTSGRILSDGRYRLLDARAGCDYHAVSIQVESSGVRP